MVKNLQMLFTRLIGSDQKYVDPSEVLNKTVDELGNTVKIGDQEDIIEFAVSFLERIDEVIRSASVNSVRNNISHFYWIELYLELILISRISMKESTTLQSPIEEWE